MIDRRLPAAFDTLGLHTDTPWSIPALRLLFANPRTYTPLVNAWTDLHPSTGVALSRLREHNYAIFQPPVIVNTITGVVATSASRAVPRYVATKKGRMLASSARADSAVLLDRYPRMSAGHAGAVVSVLSALSLEREAREVGLSMGGVLSQTSLSKPSCKWWLAKLCEDGYVTTLNFKVADTRDVVPSHWRPTAALATHLIRLVSALPQWADLAVELGLSTFRETSGISGLRVSSTGSTDYDHDIGAQEVFAAFLRSEHILPEAPWRAEKVIRVPICTTTFPWTFDTSGDGAVSYQPDGTYRERAESGRVRVAVLEYERSQTRREAWTHIERFVGYTHTHLDPSSPAVLRFVVSSRTRENTYTALVDAYTDYLERFPERRSASELSVAVSSKSRLLAAEDPLADSNWHRVLWSPGPPNCAPTTHGVENSPYHDYF